MELTLPAQPESVTLARQALNGVADAERWSPQLIGDITVATGVGCANAVRHAYPPGLTGSISVRVEWSNRDVLVVVADRGSGIAPSARPHRAGLGLGLPLMSALCNELRVRTVTDTSTEVHMAFALTPTVAGGSR